LVNHEVEKDTPSVPCAAWQHGWPLFPLVAKNEARNWPPLSR